MSTIKNLSDLYKESIKDLYSADEQSKGTTQKLAEAANSSELQSALKKGVKGIQDGLNALTEIAERHGFEPTGKHCKGMEGLCKEAEEHGIKTEYEDKDAQDAMIIAQYQRMAHYAITGYGTAQAFAKRLGHDQDVKTLEKCLDATYRGDDEFTAMATGSDGINAMAAE